MALSLPFIASRRTLLTASFFLLGGLFLQADLNTGTPPKKPDRPPPSIVPPSAQAAAVAVEVDRGGRVKLLLRGIAASEGQIEFRMLREPAAGKIISQRQVGSDSLEVVYQHGGGKRSDMDTFIFAVRRLGVGPFSPGEALIKVIDAAARVTGPELVQFAPLEIGQSDRQDLVVVNEGGTAVAGRMEVSTPWAIEGPAEFRIAGGGNQKITLRFTPDSAGELGGRLLLQGSPLLEIPLRGSAIAPFSVLTPQIALQSLPNGERGGTLILQNNTAHSVTVQLKSEVLAEQSIELKFGEVREIPIQLAGGKAITARIELAAGTYQTSVAVTGSPSSASIEAVAGPKIDLPPLQTGKSIPVTVQLRNTGGLPARLEIVASAHLQLAKTDFNIESNSDLSLQVLVVPPEPGNFRETLTVNYGDGKSIEILLRGSVLAAGQTPENAPAALSTAVPPATGAAPKAAIDERLASTRYVFPLQVIERQKTSLRLRWQAPMVGKRWRYDLEYRVLHLDAAKNLQIEWLPVPNLQIIAQNGALETVVPELDPQTQWTFRVRATPEDGGNPVISAVLTSRTIPSFHLQINWTWILFSAFLVTLLLVLRQRWKERAFSL